MCLALSQVSRQWHTLCYDGQLWTVFDATEFYKEIPVDKLTGIITKAGGFIRHLNLRYVLPGYHPVFEY